MGPGRVLDFYYWRYLLAEHNNLNILIHTTFIFHSSISLYTYSNFSHFKGYVYRYELLSDGRLFWELWSPFHCVECHLQSITVTGFVATENAIATVEYLLNKAMTLNKLMIATSSPHAYITINQRLSLIEKASPLAQVVIS